MALPCIPATNAHCNHFFISIIDLLERFPVACGFQKLPGISICLILYANDCNYRNSLAVRSSDMANNSLIMLEIIVVL